MASELSFSSCPIFIPGTKTFLYIVFCFKLCVLKKVLNTEINGKSDILVDHEFHMVSFSLSIKEWDVSVAMYMYII